MEISRRLLTFSVLMFVFCLKSRGQPPFNSASPQRFRNPGIQWYFRYICRNMRCGFEDVCELRTMPCFMPPCRDSLTCVGIPGSTDKPGRCPLAFSIETRRIGCNTDLGCPGNELCCHGYRGSECQPYFPA
ncbi:protein crumbs homolog 1-like [Pecten maximus]|uniref:protein crumbs homolog 1-like n=1 Tax=Pecten maximus TaxID=6579 RepID=UPI0014582C1E|nr:protein crumbs homolog 1-like [Pecten maximus]